MKCARWSCQLALLPVDTRCHTGAALASADFGGEPVMVVERFRYVAGERRFSNTPFGPTRRYGSPAYPSTTTSRVPSLVSSTLVPRSVTRTCSPGTDGVTERSTDS